MKNYTNGLLQKVIWKFPIDDQHPIYYFKPENNACSKVRSGAEIKTGLAGATLSTVRPTNINCHQKCQTNRNRLVFLCLLCRIYFLSFYFYCPPSCCNRRIRARSQKMSLKNLTFPFLSMTFLHLFY